MAASVPPAARRAAPDAQGKPAVGPDGAIAILAQIRSLLLHSADVAAHARAEDLFPAESARAAALAGAATAAELRRAARHELLLRGRSDARGAGGGGAEDARGGSGGDVVDRRSAMEVDGAPASPHRAPRRAPPSPAEALRAALTSAGRVRPFPGLPLLAPLPESAFPRSRAPSRAISRELSSLVVARVELDLVEWRQARLREQRERMARLRELDFGGYLAMLRARGSPRVEALLRQTERCFREIWDRVRDRAGGGREWEQEEEEAGGGGGGKAAGSSASLEALSSRWAVLARAVMAEGEKARRRAEDRIEWADAGEEEEEEEGNEKGAGEQKGVGPRSPGKSLASLLDLSQSSRDAPPGSQESDGSSRGGGGNGDGSEAAAEGGSDAGAPPPPPPAAPSSSPLPRRPALRRGGGGPPRQPPLLRGGRLHPHQQTGLTWLAGLRHLGLNGILADDMGLGKTVQVVAALADAWEEQLLGGTGGEGERGGGGGGEGERGGWIGEEGVGEGGAGEGEFAPGVPASRSAPSPPSRSPPAPSPYLALIVVPASLVETWRAELQLWLPAARVAVYGGNAEEREMVYDAFVSKQAAARLAREWERRRRALGEEREGGGSGCDERGDPRSSPLRVSPEPQGRFPGPLFPRKRPSPPSGPSVGPYPPPLPEALRRSPPPLVLLATYETLLRPLDAQRLSRHFFTYLVVDEAHRLKRASGRLRAEIGRLRASRRVLLTGTPLQTEVAELWSLLDLLMPGAFGNARSFEGWFETGGKEGERGRDQRARREAGTAGAGNGGGGGKEGKTGGAANGGEGGGKEGETGGAANGGEGGGKEGETGGAANGGGGGRGQAGGQGGAGHGLSPPTRAAFGASSSLSKAMDEQERERERLEAEEETLLVTTRLHQILRPFVLRRTKESVAWNLPPKRHVLLWCSRAPYQLALEGLARLGAGDAGTKRDGEAGTGRKGGGGGGESGAEDGEERNGGGGDRGGGGKGSETDALPSSGAGGGPARALAKAQARAPPSQKPLAPLVPSRRSRELSQLLAASFASPPVGHPLAPPPLPSPREALARGWLTPPTLAALSPRHFPPDSPVPALRAPPNLPLELRQVASDPLAARGHAPGSEALLPPHPLPPFARLCAKAALLDRLLVRFRATGHKCLVFATQTAALDGIESVLRHRGVGFLRLDGSTPPGERGELVRRWNAERAGGSEAGRKNEQLGAFLLTVRAGGVGLNLQAADTVIMYDTDWNAQIDAQAQARAHRLGQTRPVLVVRLATAETVEERVLEVVRKRTLLAERTIERGGLDGSSEPESRVQDLARFIAEAGVRERGAARERGGPLDPTDAELDAALARGQEEIPAFRAAVRAAREADRGALRAMRGEQEAGEEERSEAIGSGGVEAGGEERSEAIGPGGEEAGEDETKTNGNEPTKSAPTTDVAPTTLSPATCAFDSRPPDTRSATPGTGRSASCARPRPAERALASEAEIAPLVEAAIRAACPRQPRSSDRGGRSERDARARARA